MVMVALPLVMFFAAAKNSARQEQQLGPAWHCHSFCKKQEIRQALASADPKAVPITRRRQNKDRTHRVAIICHPIRCGSK